MSKKKLKDINIDSQNETIELSPGQKRRPKTLKKRRLNIPKVNTPITAVRDLHVKKEKHYSYLDGEKFNPPSFLTNLLKITAIGFLIVIIINSINVYTSGENLKQSVSEEAYQGYRYLIDGGKDAGNVRFNNALQAFENARSHFSDAEKKMWFVSTDNSIYSKDTNIANAINAVLEGGQHFAVAGGYFSETLEELNKLPLYFVAKNQDENLPEISINEVINKGLEKTSLAIKEISIANDKLSGINVNVLPTEIRAKVMLAKQRIEEVSTTLNTISEHFPAILKLLGDRHPQRILVLFQNNDEVRPTGGFIGSYAIIDINDAYIEKVDVQDVYDLDGSFGGMVEPPEELKGFVKNWRFRDSNYSPDFPISAKKARWFLELEGGPSVDTVIAINQGLLKDLLEITGPVQVGDFGALDAMNYNLLLTYVIEGKIWGAEDPKHILKVFVPAFKQAILKEDNVGQVAAKLYKAVQQKHILMYSTDDKVQKFFETFGFSGKVHISAEGEDYISVINSSIGGSKSDKFIEEKISHHTDIDKQGNIINSVKIERTHLWDDAVYDRWESMLQPYGLSLGDLPPHIVDVLGRGRNKVNMRIYVPEGSVLIESNDLDLQSKYDKELKKNYFFSIMEVHADESASLDIKYKLPFTLNFSDPASTYKLIAEKQAGSRGSLFNKSINLASELEQLSIYPESPELNQGNQINYISNLLYDRYFSILIRD